MSNTQISAIRKATVADSTPRETIGQSISRVIRSNIRNSVMFLVLIIVFVVFAVWSKGTFVNSFNLTMLVAQTCVVGVMACGMTLVIVIRHIDLSVGYMCGFLGAVAVILMETVHLPAILAIIMVVALGAVIGLGEGMLIGKVGIPAFVVTLGLMIAGHGLELLSTQKTGTIIANNAFFLQLSNGFLPPIFTFGTISSGSTLVIGVVGVVLFVVLQISSRARLASHGLVVEDAWWFILKIVLVFAIVGFLVYKFATFNGISYALIILGAVVVFVASLQSRTRLGRHIFGLGGNPEAAELSGVNVVKVTALVFVIMGSLVGLGGVLLASRMAAANPTAGQGSELLVIAGCFIGGCSPAGGIGRVTGSLIGALIMQSLVSGMLIVHIAISYQYVVQGGILVLAVLFDILSRRISAATRVVDQPPATPAVVSA
ncbi:MAG: hypothetical protein FWD63_06290 [Propionibacteriaceae bacterium]|nr:hypothetical protein [Propionibacteriaceae bacterium]